MKIKEKIRGLLLNNYMTQKELSESIYSTDKEVTLMRTALKIIEIKERDFRL